MYRTYGQQDDLGLRVDRAGRTVSKAAGQASLEPKAREQAMEEDQSGKGGQVLLLKRRSEREKVAERASISYSRMCRRKLFLVALEFYSIGHPLIIVWRQIASAHPQTHNRLS